MKAKRTPRKKKKSLKNVQPLILVHYINVGNLPACDVKIYLSDVAKYTATNGKEAGQYKRYFIPVINQETKVECINPIRVSSNVYNDVIFKLNETQKKLNDFLKIETK